ncbi:MAG TPA: hypothetical protein VFA41_01565 [Ktedonobacteraceae bacterium]|jgi:hypothetical protein|nr:hypothetical protein [Ktedonobacteraceae bacterium]
MRRISTKRYNAVLLVGSLLALLALMLAACGANPGSGGGSTGSAPATPTHIVVSPNGCPSTTVINTSPTPANVVLKPSNSAAPATAHVGDVIEVDLPFGHAWSGPTSSQGELHLQPPAGYELTPAKSCVWRFTAQAAGTTQLNFYGKAICKPGQMCPQYVLSVQFTVNIK